MEWISSPTDDSGAFDADGFDYGVDPDRSKGFAEAIRRCGTFSTFTNNECENGWEKSVVSRFLLQKMAVLRGFLSKMGAKNDCSTVFFYKKMGTKNGCFRMPLHSSVSLPWNEALGHILVTTTV